MAAGDCKPRPTQPIGRSAALLTNGQKWANMITQKQLKELVKYEPETGIFTRIKWNGGKSLPGQVVGTKTEGYIKFSVGNKMQYAHRMAWLYVYGEMPKYRIDHINGDKSDNRIMNLRIATHGENLQNVRIRKNNTSGKIGVYWHKTRQKWHVRITINKRVISLGMYDDFNTAVDMRRYGELMHHPFAPCDNIA